MLSSNINLRTGILELEREQESAPPGKSYRSVREMNWVALVCGTTAWKRWLAILEGSIAGPHSLYSWSLGSGNVAEANRYHIIPGTQ